MREKLDRLGINGAKMIKLYQFSPAWELPNPTATFGGCHRLFISSQLSRASAAIAVERPRPVSAKLVGLL